LNTENKYNCNKILKKIVNTLRILETLFFIIACSIFIITLYYALEGNEIWTYLTYSIVVAFGVGDIIILAILNSLDIDKEEVDTSD